MSQGFVTTKGFEEGIGRIAVGPRKRAHRPPSESVVVVTGGAGFVGCHVVRALSDSGRRVVIFDVNEPTAEGRFVIGARLAEVVYERGSIDDIARFFDVVRTHGANEIVHMATLVNPAVLTANRTTMFRVNVGGVVNVLEAAIAFDVERIVNFSSIGILPRVQYEPIDAKHPVFLADMGSGTDFYGCSKVAAEALCFAYHQTLGIDFRTIRPSAVYGVGMTPWVGPIKQMVERSVRGEKLRFEYGGKHPRDYTHASDIGTLVVAMLAAPDHADRIFYGATGRPLVTTTEVAKIVMELVPGSEIEIGEELSEGEKPIVALRGQLSIDNAREQLGWEPRYGSVRDGIARYVEDYRAFLAAQE
jgi:nucleoside-diphosphate-sugar epimerase